MNTDYGVQNSINRTVGLHCTRLRLTCTRRPYNIPFFAAHAIGRPATHRQVILDLMAAYNTCSRVLAYDGLAGG
jgi:hypothetical protein